MFIISNNCVLLVQRFTARYRIWFYLISGTIPQSIPNYETTYRQLLFPPGKWVPTMKEAMYVITGLDMGIAREPQGILTEAQVTQLRSDLTALGLAKS